MEADMTDLGLRADLEQEVDGPRAHCEQLVDLFAGLAGLFGTVALVVALAGLIERQPLFAFSSCFAIAATFAFCVSARRVAQIGRELEAKPVLARPRRLRPERREAA